MKHYIFTACVAATMLAACSSSSEKNADEVGTMLVEQYFDAPDVDEISPRIRVVSVFQPEFTDSTILQDPSIDCIADGRVYIHDQSRKAHSLSAFDRSTGKLLSSFNRYGQGPEEYMYSYHSYFTPADSSWTILDNNFGRNDIKQYGADGTWRHTQTNDSISVLAPLPDGGWLAVNDITLNRPETGFQFVKDRIVYRYSPSWELLWQSTLPEKRLSAREVGAWSESLNTFNGQAYLTVADTVMRFNPATDALEPAIYMNQGRYYSPDWWQVETIEGRQEMSKLHLQPLHPIFNSRYAFVSYYMPGTWNLRYDAYDLRDGRLVFRAMAPDDDFTNPPIIPVTIDGKVLRGWPVEFVDNDHFIIKIGEDELAEVLNLEEANPLFVEVALTD